MCRYSCKTYKEHFACFRCRKAFKRTARADLPAFGRPQYGKLRMVPCPECGEPMAEMGHDFRAPPQRDKRQWRKVEILYEQGFAFCSCGCGPGPRPANLREMKDFLVSTLPESAGAQLLEKIANKKAMGSKRRRQRGKRAERYEAKLGEPRPSARKERRSRGWPFWEGFDITTTD